MDILLTTKNDNPFPQVHPGVRSPKQIAAEIRKKNDAKVISILARNSITVAPECSSALNQNSKQIKFFSKLKSMEGDT